MREAPALLGYHPTYRSFLEDRRIRERGGKRKAEEQGPPVISEDARGAEGETPVKKTGKEKEGWSSFKAHLTKRRRHSIQEDIPQPVRVSDILAFEGPGASVT